MFGWEFPPNISGGLGTACQGIVKGLSACKDIHVLFVIPKSFGNENTSHFELIDAEKVATTDKISFTEHSSSFSTIEISSRLLPYQTPEDFSKQKHFSNREVVSTKQIGQADSTTHHEFHFTGKYGPNLFDEINNYAVVARLIAKKHQFELIHVHDWLTFPAGIAAKQVSGKPLIAHVHSTDFDRSGGKINPSIYAIEKQGFEHADKIITVSNLIKRRIVEDYGISPTKITTVYNAIDPAKSNHSPKTKKKHTEKVVTFLGRITIQKGPEYFVEVAKLVLQRMKNVRFVMAGNGDMMAKMIELSAKYGISDKFQFAGFLKGAEVHQMLRISDVFIMPSVSEPFGIVPLEAMQVKVPVIISLQSGVAELIKNVIKIDFWDIHAMVDAIHGIIRYKPLSKMMANEGKQEVDKLNWKLAASHIRNIYLNLI